MYLSQAKQQMLQRRKRPPKKQWTQVGGDSSDDEDDLYERGRVRFNTDLNALKERREAMAAGRVQYQSDPHYMLEITIETPWKRVNKPLVKSIYNAIEKFDPPPITKPYVEQGIDPRVCANKKCVIRARLDPSFNPDKITGLLAAMFSKPFFEGWCLSRTEGPSAIKDKIKFTSKGASATVHFSAATDKTQHDSEMQIRFTPYDIDQATYTPRPFTRSGRAIKTPKKFDPDSDSDTATL